MSILATLLALFWVRPMMADPVETRGIAVDRHDPSGIESPVAWAVFIGVDAYQKVRPLRYCVADATLLADTMAKRAGLHREQMLIMTTKESPDRQPTRSNILERVPAFLQKVRRGDSVIVFFSGHGFCDSSGSTYLAPVECDPDNLGLTAVPLAMLRKDLESCQASVKLLIVDACHSGNTKGLDQELTGKTLERELKSAVGVYTLASCQANETSLIDDKKEQGLFTYWLNRGLEGGADDNADGAIGAEELYRFVHFQVSNSAQHLSHQRQTPVQIVGPDVSGIPIVVRLKPEPVMNTLRRIAELVHEQALCHNVKKLGVLEFTCLVGNQETLRGDIGPFGRTAAEKIEQALVEHAAGAYAVADQRQVRYATKNMTIEALGDPTALRELRNAPPNLEAVLIGTFLRVPDPDQLRVNCKLLQLPAGDVLASVSGVVHIDKNLWALLGHSADLTQVTSASYSRPVLDPTRRTQTEIPELQPLLRDDFPYRIAIYSHGRCKKWLQRPDSPNNLYFSARPDEQFEIHVENRSPRPVLMRLLVDGVNTLVQNDEDTDVRHVLLDEARGWILDPNSKYTIEGWYLGVGDNARMRRFQFVDPPRSVAGQLGFGGDIGMITAAFYARVATRGLREKLSLGVGKGREERRTVLEAKPFPVGPMLATVTVRYVQETR